MSRRNLGLTLIGVALALLPIVGAGAYVVKQDDKPSVQVKWIYSPREVMTTAQKGVSVVCQGKTNSLPFATYQRAKPGDVLIQTCRAVKTATLEKTPAS